MTRLLCTDLCPSLDRSGRRRGKLMPVGGPTCNRTGVCTGTVGLGPGDSESGTQSAKLSFYFIGYILGQLCFLDDRSSFSVMKAAIKFTMIGSLSQTVLEKNS